MLVRQVDHQPQGLALAAPTRQPVDRDRVAAAVAAEDDEAVGGFSHHSKARPVAFLVFLLGGGAGMALDGADPTFLRAQHGYRLALDERGRRDLDRLGRTAEQRAAPAERSV